MVSPHCNETNTDSIGTPDKDTEKTPGMFGTMVIALPSQHDGGDVVVSFNGKSETLQTSSSSAWSTSYLAW